MTGELADCYETKIEGVRHILGQVGQAAEDRMLRVYRSDGHFVSATAAVADPEHVAAANWHALAQLAGRFASSGSGLLVDIGSTTADVIPLVDGLPNACGTSDTERLATGELVYTGVTRTPVAALVRELPYRGRTCGVARELFATTRDVYLTLGDLPELVTDCNTADGRGATCAAARRRLARMICADTTHFSAEDAEQMAIAVMQCQLDLLGAAIEQVVDGQEAVPQQAVVSGSGEFLARRAIRSGYPNMVIQSLTELASGPISTCAAAHAVALLAREQSE
jgi:probable H4MPT-linked C1 transfer pathway protein